MHGFLGMKDNRGHWDYQQMPPKREWNNSVDHVQHEYRYTDGGARDDHRIWADMKGPLVLALVVIDQSRGGYEPPTLLLRHTNIFLILGI